MQDYDFIIQGRRVGYGRLIRLGEKKAMRAFFRGLGLGAIAMGIFVLVIT